MWTLVTRRKSPPRDTPAGPYDEPEPHHEIEEQSHRRSLRPTKEVDYYPPAQLRRPRAPVIPGAVLNIVTQPRPSEITRVMEMLLKMMPIDEEEQAKVMQTLTRGNQHIQEPMAYHPEPARRENEVLGEVAPWVPDQVAPGATSQKLLKHQVSDPDGLMKAQNKVPEDSVCTYGMNCGPTHEARDDLHVGAILLYSTVVSAQKEGIKKIIPNDPKTKSTAIHAPKNRKEALVSPWWKGYYEAELSHGN